MEESFKNIFLLSKFKYGSCYYCFGYCKIKDDHIYEEYIQNDPAIENIPDNIKLINDYIDNGMTAICPHCGIDSIFPGILSKDELKKLHEYWFVSK